MSSDLSSDFARKVAAAMAKLRGLAKPNKDIWSVLEDYPKTYAAYFRIQGSPFHCAEAIQHMIWNGQVED